MGLFNRKAEGIKMQTDVRTILHKIESERINFDYIKKQKLDPYSSLAHWYNTGEGLEQLTDEDISFIINETYPKAEGRYDEKLSAVLVATGEAQYAEIGQKMQDIIKYRDIKENEKREKAHAVLTASVKSGVTTMSDLFHYSGAVLNRPQQKNGKTYTLSRELKEIEQSTKTLSEKEKNACTKMKNISKLLQSSVTVLSDLSKNEAIGFLDPINDIGVMVRDTHDRSYYVVEALNSEPRFEFIKKENVGKIR